MSKIHLSLIVCGLFLVSSCNQPPQQAMDPTPATTASTVLEEKVALSGETNPGGRVFKVEVHNQETHPIAVASADHALQGGWKAVFRHQGHDYTWPPPEKGERLPLSEDFRIIKPDEKAEFVFPLANYKAKIDGNEESLGLDGEAEVDITYQVDALTLKRWPKPEPGTPENDVVKPLKQASLKLAFQLGERKGAADEPDDGPPKVHPGQGDRELPEDQPGQTDGKSAAESGDDGGPPFPHPGNKESGE